MNSMMIVVGLIMILLMIIVILVSAKGIEQYNMITEGSGEWSDSSALVPGAARPVGWLIATAIFCILGLQILSVVPVIGTIIGFAVGIAALVYIGDIKYTGKKNHTVMAANVLVIAGGIVGLLAGAGMFIGGFFVDELPALE
jgi:preprotein translocase subunit SecG